MCFHKRYRNRLHKEKCGDIEQRSREAYNNIQKISSMALRQTIKLSRPYFTQEGAKNSTCFAKRGKGGWQ